MGLVLEPVKIEDFPFLTEIYFKAFQDPISLNCFPRTKEVRRWWTTGNEDEFQKQPTARFLKIVENDKIIAYAKWNVPAAVDGAITSGGDNPDDMPVWPKDGDTELCEEFFGTLARRHGEIMGNRPHCCELSTLGLAIVELTTKPDLEIIATLPEHQGRGAAGRLIRWGLEQADKAKIESYIEASPLVVPIYERYGWRTIEEFKPSKVEHIESIMLRAAVKETSIA